MAGRWNDEWRDRGARTERDWRDEDRERYSGSEGRSWDRNDRVFGERESGVDYGRAGTGRSDYGRGSYGARPDDDWLSGGSRRQGEYGGSSRYAENHPAQGWQAADYGGVSPAMQRGGYDSGYRSNPQDARRESGRYGGQRQYRSEWDSHDYGEGHRFGTREADERWAREMRRPASGGPLSGGAGGYDYDERGYGDGGRYGRDRDFEDRARDAGDFFRRTGEKVRSWFNDATRDDDERGYYEAGHRGRGPKGYKRSDERISEDAHQRLTDDPWLDASAINVSVSGSEVTLSGTVTSREAKHRAERIVEDISGVNHVQNNLRVDKGSYFTSAGRGYGDSVQEARLAGNDPVKDVTDGNTTPPAQKRN